MKYQKILVGDFELDEPILMTISHSDKKPLKDLKEFLNESSHTYYSEFKDKESAENYIEGTTLIRKNPQWSIKKIEEIEKKYGL